MSKRLQSVRSGSYSLTRTSIFQKVVQLAAGVPGKVADSNHLRKEISVQVQSGGPIRVSPAYPSSQGILVASGATFQDMDWKGEWWAVASSASSVLVVEVSEA
jgi:hypothetical protein